MEQTTGAQQMPKTGAPKQTPDAQPQTPTQPGTTTTTTLKVGANGTTMSQIVKITGVSGSTSVTAASLYYYCMGSSFISSTTSCYFTYTAVFGLAGSALEIGVSTSFVAVGTTAPTGVIVSNLLGSTYTNAINLLGGTVEITGLTTSTIYYPFIRYKPGTTAGSGYNIHGYITQF